MPRIAAHDLLDVFVYTAVLATFTQFLPAVISESFLTSLVTALLLKVVLEVVLWLKRRILARIRSATTARMRVISAITLVLVGGGSKALVLWITDLVLGDAVYLGGFAAVTLLVMSLMLARAMVRKLVKRCDTVV